MRQRERQPFPRWRVGLTVWLMTDEAVVQLAGVGLLGIVTQRLAQVVQRGGTLAHT